HGLRGKHTPGVAGSRDRWAPRPFGSQEQQKVFALQPEGPVGPRPEFVPARNRLIEDGLCSMPRLRLVVRRLSTVPEHVVELHRCHSVQKAAQELDGVQSAGANLTLLN